MLHGAPLQQDATQAAIRAGYSAKTAGQIGERLLRNVEIQAELSERMKAREQRTENNHE